MHPPSAMPRKPSLASCAPTVIHYWSAGRMTTDVSLWFSYLSLEYAAASHDPTAVAPLTLPVSCAPVVIRHWPAAWVTRVGSGVDLLLVARRRTSVA